MSDAPDGRINAWVVSAPRPKKPKAAKKTTAAPVVAPVIEAPKPIEEATPEAPTAPEVA